MKKKMDWSKYFIELMILILGISISFVLNERRQMANNAEAKTFLIKQFESNMKNDLKAIDSQIKFIETMLQSAENLTNLEAITEPDSTNRDVAIMMNTVSYPFSSVAYVEAIQTGEIKLIKDRTLLQNIIKLYSETYEQIKGWHDIDKKIVSEDIMGFYIKKMPFAKRLHFSNDPVKTKQFERVILTDEYKNLIQTNQIIKNGILQLYKQTKKDIQEILDIIAE